MNEQTITFSPVKKFFLICSGSDLNILSRPECAIEINKYIGIGATILSTAVLACLSGGYALFKVFNPLRIDGQQPSIVGYVIPIFFGLLWGAIIFNLDRYIVSTIRKPLMPPGSSFRELMRWKFNEFARIAPRLFLAIFISIIITRPLELKMFETEITKEMLRQTSSDVADMAARIDREFPDIDRLTRENQALQSQTETKRKQVNDLYELALAEGMGEERGNTTGRKGKGPFYKERMDAYERAQKELGQLEQTNNKKIHANETTLDDLRRRKDEADRMRQPTIAQNGLVAELKTLSSLSEQNPPIKLANWVLIFLFIMLETAPIIVKTLSARGPYDEIYETLEHFAIANEQKKIFEIDSELDAHITLTERLHAETLAAKLQLNRRMMDSLETLAAIQILEAQTEIAQLIVAQWKTAQKNNLRGGPVYGFQNGNSASANLGVAMANETSNAL